MLALTFDDGPDAAATPALLDVLERRGVRATFFVFGSRAVEHPRLIARMVEAGHGVQPHCWAGHRSHHDLGPEELEADIAQTLAALASLACPLPTLWRPPNGDISDPLSYEVAARHGLELVTWTLQTCDWNDAHSVARILRDIDGAARGDALLGPDAVVLMHDTRKTVGLLEGLLERIARRGYDTGPLRPGSAAAATGGEHRFGRRDGRPPCGLAAAS